MKRDKVQAHVDGLEDQSDQAYLRAAAHMGVFVRWSIERDAFDTSDSLDNKSYLAAVDLVRAAKMPGGEFILEYCDGKIDSSLFYPPHDRFFDCYYHDYLEWFDRFAGERRYRLDESELDFARIREELDRAYAYFRESDPIIARTQIESPKSKSHCMYYSRF